jgi:hypothetical protein
LIGALLSAEERHAEHPDTFQIPDWVHRRMLKPGDVAKVIFEPRDADCLPERIWVRVTHCVSVGYVGGYYIGTLANDPLFLPAKFGHVVRFCPEHIVDIEWRAER